MSRKQTLQDLSVDELRWLLIQKRRISRQDRLERFRRTGRVLTVASDAQDVSVDQWRTSPLSDLEERPAPRSRSRRALDGFLYLVEIGAAAGLIFILFTFLNLRDQMNREAALALVVPTPSPTPIIMAVVLPSGHTPPDSPGGAQFNEAEIPAHLRARVQQFSSVAPAATPGPEQAVRIQISAISVNSQVVQGDTWEQLKKGVAQHLGTANPGEKGNVVLSGHNDIFGQIFRDLDRLKPGDELTLFTSQRGYTYVVVDTQVVEPTAVEVMAATTQPTVTLISCYPYLVDNQRIVVTARLKSGG